MDLMLGVPTGKSQKTLQNDQLGNRNTNPTPLRPCLRWGEVPVWNPQSWQPEASALESMESSRGEVLASAAVVRRRGAAVPHVEVDNVLCVSPLHRNGERLKGVEGEGDEATHRVVDGAAQQACLDLKLQQARVPGVEPKQRKDTVLYHCHLEIRTAGEADPQ